MGGIGVMPKNNTVGELGLARLGASQARVVAAACAAREAVVAAPAPAAAAAARGMLLARAQLHRTGTLLGGVARNAALAIEALEDLDLAMREGAPELARDVFGSVSQWSGELRDDAVRAQKELRGAIGELGSHVADVRGVPLYLYAEQHSALAPAPGAAETARADLEADTANATFSSSSVAAAPAAAEAAHEAQEHAYSTALEHYSPAAVDGAHALTIPITAPESSRFGTTAPAPAASATTVVTASNTSVASVARGEPATSAKTERSVATAPSPTFVTGHTQQPANQPAFAAVCALLGHMELADSIFEQMCIFWGDAEASFSAQQRRAEHVARFVGAASASPPLVARFNERCSQFRAFWQRAHDVAVEFEIIVTKLREPFLLDPCGDDRPNIGGAGSGAAVAPLPLANSAAATGSRSVPPRGSTTSVGADASVL